MQCNHNWMMFDQAYINFKGESSMYTSARHCRLWSIERAIQLMLHDISRVRVLILETLRLVLRQTANYKSSSKTDQLYRVLGL